MPVRQWEEVQEVLPAVTWKKWDSVSGPVVVPYSKGAARTSSKRPWQCFPQPEVQETTVTEGQTRP